MYVVFCQLIVNICVCIYIYKVHDTSYDEHLYTWLLKQKQLHNSTEMNTQRDALLYVFTLIIFFSPTYRIWSISDDDIKFTQMVLDIGNAIANMDCYPGIVQTTCHRGQKLLTDINDFLGNSQDHISLFE